MVRASIQPMSTTFPGITYTALARVSEEVERRWPGGRVITNAVGNLIVAAGPEVDSPRVAYVDLYDGEIVEF